MSSVKPVLLAGVVALGAGVATLEPTRSDTPVPAAMIALPPPAPVQDTHKRVVVLGIDGLDPEILADVIARHPERMANFKRLVEEPGGSGIVLAGMRNSKVGVGL